MAPTTFDTLDFAEKLKAAGFSEAQAKAMVEAQRDSQAESISGSLATKADLLLTKTDLQTVRFEFKSDMMEAKLDIIVSNERES